MRLVAATHRDLKQMVAKSSSGVISISGSTSSLSRCLRLRERREDIPLLVKFFAEDCVRRINRRVKTIPADTMRVLAEYDWPGNVRELQNFIERAVILSPGSELRAPLEDLDWSKRASQLSARDAGAGRVWAHSESSERNGWVVGGPMGAARRLGLKRTTLIGKMRKMGILRSTEAVLPPLAEPCTP